MDNDLNIGSAFNAFRKINFVAARGCSKSLRTLPDRILSMINNTKICQGGDWMGGDGMHAGFYIRLLDGTIQELLSRDLTLGMNFDEPIRLDGESLFGEKCDINPQLSEDWGDTSALDEFLSQIKVHNEGGDNV